MRIDSLGDGWTGEHIHGGWSRTIPFTAGDGISEYIEVSHWAEFPRGIDGTCAYCGGDPYAEDPVKPKTQQIHDFYIRNRAKIARRGGHGWRADTCPACQGRAT